MSHNALDLCGNTAGVLLLITPRTRTAQTYLQADPASGRLSCPISTWSSPTFANTFLQGIPLIRIHYLDSTMPARISRRTRKQNASPSTHTNGTADKSMSSMASSARSRRAGVTYSQNKRPIFSPGPSEDLEDVNLGSLPPGKVQRYLISVDFGTTFSSISYFFYSTNDEKVGVRPSDIRTIKDWPDDTLNNGKSE